MPDVSVTWLGHAAFRIDSPNGKRVYVDPWLDNPECPENERKPVSFNAGHLLRNRVGSSSEFPNPFDN